MHCRTNSDYCQRRCSNIVMLWLLKLGPSIDIQMFTYQWLSWRRKTSESFSDVLDESSLYLSGLVHTYSGIFEKRIFVLRFETLAATLAFSSRIRPSTRIREYQQCRLRVDGSRLRRIRVELTVSFPSSKRTFSQPFKEKCISDAVRIGSVIIFHLKSYEKPGSSYCAMKCFTLGSERV